MLLGPGVGLWARWDGGGGGSEGRGGRCRRCICRGRRGGLGRVWRLGRGLLLMCPIVVVSIQEVFGG